MAVKEFHQDLGAVALLACVLSCARSEESSSTPAPASKPTTRTPTAEEDTDVPQQCLQRFTVDSDQSVLSEQRSRAGEKRWDDFPKRYPAAYLDPDAQRPVDAVREFQIGATPLLWFTSDFSEAVVNAAVLSELTVVDATGLEAGARVQVGALTELGLGKVAKRDFVRFLARADVIQTYMHIGSVVCLYDEREDASGFRLAVTGEHTYFTNEKNVDPFGFEVSIEPGGTIWVTGAEPVAFERDK